MFATFGKLFTDRTRHASLTRPSGGRASQRRRRRPDLECLEGRQLLTLGVELPVSTAPTTDNESDTASAGNGVSVVVWVSSDGGSDTDILAQRYDKYGHEVGPQILVDDTGVISHQPSVSMDNSGKFTVVWTNFGVNSLVMMRRFNANGSAATGIIQVSDSGENSSLPDVAVNSNSSNTVVVYQHDFESNANDQDVIAERFTTFTDTIGDEITVAGLGQDELNPTVAMTTNGTFGVAYQEINATSDILYKRYSATGGFLASLVINNSATTDANNPDVDMDNKGNAVIVYSQNVFSDFGVYGRRVNSKGVLGSEFVVSDDLPEETFPRVAVEPVAAPGTTAPAFVVAFNYFDSDSFTGGVQIAELDANNNLVFLSDVIVGAADAAITIDGLNRYTLTYTRLNGNNDVFRRTSWLTV